MLTACKPEKDPIQSISQEDDNRKLEDLEAKLRQIFIYGRNSPMQRTCSQHHTQ